LTRSSNALKFSPDEGYVTVRIGPEDANHFRIEVEDRGVGIKPEDLGQLFVEFEQLDASMAKKHAGTGLGLAQATQTAEADPPAAVILNPLMPGADGFEFLTRFRSTAAGRRTPVIVWTNKDLTLEDRTRLRVCAQAVVPKGAGANALIQELAVYVTLPRPVPPESEAPQGPSPGRE